MKNIPGYDKQRKKSKDLPEGFILVKNKMEIVIDMQLLCYDGDFWTSDCREILSSLYDKIISEERLAYQKLTKEMLEGEKAWWDWEKLRNDNPAEYDTEFEEDLPFLSQPLPLNWDKMV